jgi:hypothetical protein
MPKIFMPYLLQAGTEILKGVYGPRIRIRVIAVINCDDDHAVRSRVDDANIVIVKIQVEIERCSDFPRRWINRGKQRPFTRVLVRQIHRTIETDRWRLLHK